MSALRPGEDFGDANRRMAAGILAGEPMPYAEGGYVLRVVELHGRSSGRLLQLPIAVVTLGGRRYLVSPVRDRNWARNLVADPSCVVRTRDRSEPCRAVPVDDPDRAADVVATYVAKMEVPWALAQFPFPPDAGRQQIRDSVDRVAVFELQAEADG